MAQRVTLRDLFFLALLAPAAILLHGYHIGFQDQAIYLPAIKHHLNPLLYPHDSAFFLSQVHWMLFDELVANTVRITRLPLDVTLFLLHLVSIFLILVGCLQLARRCFAESASAWAATLTMWAALLLPVAGTGLHIVDRYLHPRNLAAGCILMMFVAVLDRKPFGLLWMVPATLIHPTMALLGALHLLFQVRKLPRAAFAVLPLAALWPAANEAWRELLQTRAYLFPLRWMWYEWVGVVAPLVLLAWFARLGKDRRLPLVQHISRRLLLSGSLGVAGGVLISLVPPLELLIPTEPMRALHLVYVIMVLFGGGLVGQFFLKDRPLRWGLFFVPICAVMFYSHHVAYPASPHIEWPGRPPRNAWVEGFDWVRTNTPRDAYFALDPRYMLRPGEDSHGFRAFAERSMMADWVKDRAVAALTPKLAPAWLEQVQAREGWRKFTADDFRCLRRRFGVSWVVVEQPGVAGLSCPYQNEAVRVCRIE